MYIGRSQETVADLVATQSIFELYAQEIGYYGGGGSTGAVVDADDRGSLAEGHVKSGFGSGKGAVDTGIM